MNDQDLLRYSRHILLQDFDVEGQEKLLKSSVLVVGAGGLGCPVVMYLAAAGVGKIKILDDDLVELSNLQRQIGHFDESIDKPKSGSLKVTALKLNPTVTIEAVQARITRENASSYIEGVDVLIDCSDNFQTRALVNQLSVENKIPLVSGAAVRSEGQLAVYHGGLQGNPCYACVFGDALAFDENCSENGVLAPVVGVVGSLQAVEVLKLIAGYGDVTFDRLRLIDFKSGEWRSLGMKEDPGCPVCSGK